MTAAFASLLALLMVEHPIRVEASAQPNSAPVVLELKKYFGVFIDFSIVKGLYKAISGEEHIQSAGLFDHFLFCNKGYITCYAPRSKANFSMHTSK